jgi:hypothetical protein
LLQTEHTACTGHCCRKNIHSVRVFAADRPYSLYRSLLFCRQTYSMCRSLLQTEHRLCTGHCCRQKIEYVSLAYILQKEDSVYTGQCYSAVSTYSIYRSLLQTVHYIPVIAILLTEHEVFTGLCYSADRTYSIYRSLLQTEHTIWTGQSCRQNIDYVPDIAGDRTYIMCQSLLQTGYRVCTGHCYSLDRI